MVSRCFPFFPYVEQNVLCFKNHSRNVGKMITMKEGF